jgi:hypothetical protein
MGSDGKGRALTAEPSDEEFRRCVGAVRELIDSGQPLVFATALGGFGMEDSALQQAAERHGVTADRLRTALRDEIPQLASFPTLDGPTTFGELVAGAGEALGHARLVSGGPTLRETLAQRLSKALGSVAEAADPYDRLDAFGGFRVAVGRAVTRARAAGLRGLGKALMMVRDAVGQLRAEELENRHLLALESVLGRLATRDPSSEDLVRIDRELWEVGLDWVPHVELSEEEEG